VDDLRLDVNDVLERRIDAEKGEKFGRAELDEEANTQNKIKSGYLNSKALPYSF
jgi:hypothetical protein